MIGDITAGMTVAVMHIPQGMAYGILAGVSPSVGLYTAVFESLLYFIFGTSKHISIGNVAFKPKNKNCYFYFYLTCNRL